MAQIVLFGRLLVGGYYLMSAFYHFADLRTLSRFAAGAGVPMPEVAVIVAGILLAIGGVSLLLGIYPLIGVASLVMFFVPVTVMMHPFWADRDAMMRQMDIVNFSKNVALLGSSLMFLGIPHPWPFSVERRAHLAVRSPV